MNQENDDPEIKWNERARDPGRMSPKMACRAIQSALPADASVSFDNGNNCAIGSASPSFGIGSSISPQGSLGHAAKGSPESSAPKADFPDVPRFGSAGGNAFGNSMNETTACRGGAATTMAIFRNCQWGAEKRDTNL